MAKPKTPKSAKPTGTSKAAASDTADEDVSKIFEEPAKVADTTEVSGPDVAPPANREVVEKSDVATDAPSDVVADEVEATTTDADVAPKPEPDPEPAPPTPPAPVPVQVQRKGGFFPLLMGGVVAAALGFIAGRADLFGLGGPEVPTVDLTEVTGALDANGARIASLEDRLATVETAAPEPSTVDLTPVKGAVDALAQRLAALEAAPTPEGTGINRAEMRAMQDRVADQQAQIDALLAEAQGARAEAAARARLAALNTDIARLSRALDAGESYGEELTAVASNFDAPIPDALSANADTGVMPLSALQQNVAEAARAALAAARSADTEGATGVGDFLRRQLGARSVVPREGDDPDAVLSRIEAATKTGDLTTALAEAAALPQPAQDAMADWMAAAQTRLDALAAADAILTAANED